MCGVENNKVSRFQEKRSQRAVEIERIATVQRYLVSVGADKKFFDMCGLPYRTTRPAALCTRSGAATATLLIGTF